LKPDITNQGIHIVEIESDNLDKIRHNHQTIFKKLYKKNDRVMFPTIQMRKDNKTTMYNDKRDFETMRSKMVTHFKMPSSKKKSKSVKKTPKQKGGRKTNSGIRLFQKDLNDFINELVKKMT
jgi:hypothetical protein